jgi:hypothetical protein
MLERRVGEPPVGSITIVVDRNNRFTMPLEWWREVYAGERDAPAALLRYVIRMRIEDEQIAGESVNWRQKIIEDQTRIIREQIETITKLRRKLAKGEPVG